ncbi:retrovirus-related pol polyprotein from transposon TNT 1-94 [Tanacetum coccineum]|uniref:Retrovirus-related pol polyprotein from transposon TNT 1-94 n=1 Tax=Tanacetum coccineum TaxID=301880 RepID=A0ABQ5EEU2_9ASTR
MAAVEVPQTLEYMGGQLNVAPVLEVENFTNWKKRFMCHIIDDQMNSVINCLTAKSTWDDLILYHEGRSDVRESRVMDLKLCYNTFKFKEGESLTQTFTRYKSLMNELVNDGIKLSKLEINTDFINGLPKKWLSFCQSLKNTNNVKDSELASLFDSPDDEEDIRSSHEYLNDLEEEYQERALLAKSKRFFKKGTKRFSSTKATDQTKCHKCGKKGHFTRDCWSKTLVSTYQSPFQPKPLSSPLHKPELRPTKDFEAKYNKVKAKLAFLSSSASDSKASMVKNKCLIVEAYEWDEEEVSSDDNEIVEVKVLMALAEENDVVSKEGARNSEWVKISMRKCDIKKPIWYLDSECSRHMTGVKSYLHKYVEQSGPKVVFGDDSTSTTEGYGSIKCNGIKFTKVAFVNGLKYNPFSISQLCDAKYIIQFDEKRGTIFNSNKEVVMIAPRVRDVYVLDMTSSAQESCFFAKAYENLNWLYHKRLTHLNFKIINKLAKQNLVIGLLSLYSRYNWVYFLKKKSQAPESIMSFIKRVENQNDIKVKQLKTDNGTEFRNNILLNFCDEKEISQNFFSSYTPEQNGVAERKNITLIEAARTMLSASVFSKQYWTEAIATTCYTQNKSTIVKRHLKTPYKFFYHLGKFDEKADDRYLLGFSLVSKAFRVFNTRRQKLKKPITSYLMKALMLSNSQNLQLTTSTLLKQKDIHMKNIFILINPLKVSSDQNGQTDQNGHNNQNDQSIQNDEILNDDHYEHSNHTNDEQIFDNLPNTKGIQISEQLSSLRVEMLTRAMAKQLSAASAHECLFVDFLSEEEPKKVSEALKNPG